MAISRTQLRWLIVAARPSPRRHLDLLDAAPDAPQVRSLHEFHGGQPLRHRQGATADEAIRSARDIDCQLLSNGRDENVVCGNTEPASVRQIR